MGGEHPLGQAFRLHLTTLARTIKQQVQKVKENDVEQPDLPCRARQRPVAQAVLLYQSGLLIAVGRDCVDGRTTFLCGGCRSADHLPRLGCSRQRYRCREERRSCRQPEPSDQRRRELGYDDSRDPGADNEHELGSRRFRSMGDLFRPVAAWNCRAALENEWRSVGDDFERSPILCGRCSLHLSGAKASGAFYRHGCGLRWRRRILLPGFGNLADDRPVASQYASHLISATSRQ